jgi:hypothetical protein
LFRVPLTNALPAFTLYYSALPAEKVEFKEDYVEFSYSPVHMNLVKDSVYEELPDIDSAFDLSNKEDRAFMAIADENVLNGIFRTMGKLDKFYSAR